MRRTTLGTLTALASIAATSVLTALPAEAAPATLTAPATLANTIALSNCSASLVRFPTSTDTDRALMLTNGHCYEGGMPGAGVVLQNKTSSRSGNLLDAAGNSLGTVRADTMLYSTMTATDITLYRLADTFAALRTRYGATPMTLTAARPADGQAMTIPSSYWKRTWNCTLNGFTDLREGEWSFTDSIRYDAACDTIHGTSGSPIVSDATGEVIGINNTGNDSGEMCTLNNPCEVAADGTTTAHQGQSYGQQVWWISTCVNSSHLLDLTVAGCKLPGATSTPPPTGTNLLQNAGFESGAVNWTGTSGPITNDSGRPARTGTWKLWLGGNGRATNENEAQTVTIPSTATSATLSLWIRIDTAEKTSTTVYDTARMQIVNGSTTSTLATYSNLNATGTYVQKSFDVTAYKGQTISVKFLMSEDSSLQTSFVIDDTALSVS
jgi:hypothetical protein